MNEEKLLDAMQYLPDGMLEQTDRLRRKRPAHWKPLVAMAACLCLLMGIGWGWLFSGAKSVDDAAPECGMEEDVLSDSIGITNQSTVMSDLLAQVITVTEDTLTVSAEDVTYTVSLGALKDKPALAPGQWVRIFAKRIRPNMPIEPYRIMIEEDIP